MNIPKIKICQHGTDGFGHQLEGTLRLISLSLNGKADYQYNYQKEYTFEHTNFNKQKLIQYFRKANKILCNEFGITNTENYRKIKVETRTFRKIIYNDKMYAKNLYLYDGVAGNKKFPPNFEEIDEVQKSLPLLKKAFVKKNDILPKPSFNDKFINVSCHIRKGDAVGKRILDNHNLIKVVKHYQNQNDRYRVIIHSDGNMSHMKNPNTFIYGAETDVLQVLSDFVHSDILIINFSSLSIAAHLLSVKNQTVICPSVASPTFKPRILPTCIPCDEFLKNPV